MLVITAFCIDEREKSHCTTKDETKNMFLYTVQKVGGGVLGTNVCLHLQKPTSSQYFQQFNLYNYLLSSPDIPYSFYLSYFLDVYTSFTCIQ